MQRDVLLSMQRVKETFNTHDWLQNFRMCKEMFYYLYRELRRPLVLMTGYRTPECAKRRFIFFMQRVKTCLVLESTCLRQAISVERCVAVGLWCLATPSEYQTIGHLFGIARSTLCRIMQEVVDSIVNCRQGV